METTNFDKKDTNEDGVIAPEQPPVENIEQGESSSKTENIADINQIEDQVVELEGEITKHVEQTNEVRADLGLPPESPENIPALKNKISTLDKFKNYLKNTAKAVTMAGIMLAGTSEATAQTNKTLDKNIEKTEVKTEIASFYDKLQEYKIIPESMTEVEFQEKAKDENWKKSIAQEYIKARGIKPITDPNAKIIKEINYGLNVEAPSKEYVNVLTEAQRKQEIENIWKMVNKGKLKMGDSFTLSNGEIYVIKNYTPNTYKKSVVNNNTDADVASGFKLLKDYK
jgi:hypothetical protein